MAIKSNGKGRYGGKSYSYSTKEPVKKSKYLLKVNYWSGDFTVGTFESKKAAKEYFEKNKGRFRDYRGEKYGFPYGTPLISKLEK